MKPGNILVTAAPLGHTGRAEHVKLLDFGLAKLTQGEQDATQTIEGTVAGTAPYMSPEQARGEPVDSRSTSSVLARCCMNSWADAAP